MGARDATADPRHCPEQVRMVLLRAEIGDAGDPLAGLTREGDGRDTVVRLGRVDEVRDIPDAVAADVEAVAAPVGERLVDGDDTVDAAGGDAVQPRGAVAEIGAAVVVVPDERAFAGEGRGDAREEERRRVRVDDRDTPLLDEADELAKGSSVELALA